MCVCDKIISTKEENKMKRYSFYVDGKLKRSGTKEEIYEISNKENCLCKYDFDEVDKNGRFSYHCNVHCVLLPENKTN